MIKLGEVVMILDLHRQGLSVSAIALQLGIDRKTVRKYLARGLEAPVELTALEFRLISYLLHHQGKVVSRPSCRSTSTGMMGIATPTPSRS